MSGVTGQGRQRLSFEIGDQNIPYPEYSELSIKLDSQYLNHREKIKGCVKVGIKEGFPNSFEDVIVEVQVASETLFSNLTYYKCSLFNNSQHGATVFEEGLPAGLYEFPFSFRLPHDLPASVALSENVGKSDGIEFGREFLGNVTYKIHANVIHKKSVLNRPSLRISAPFYRKFSQFVTPEMKPMSVLKPKSLLKNEQASIKVELQKDVFYKGEDVAFNIISRTNSSTSFRNVTVSIFQKLHFSVNEEDSKLTHSNRKLICKQVVKELLSISPSERTMTIPVRVNVEAPKSGKCAIQPFDGTLSPSMSCHLDDGEMDVSYEVQLDFRRIVGRSHRVTIPFVLSDVPGPTAREYNSCRLSQNACGTVELLSTPPRSARNNVENVSKLLSQLNYEMADPPAYEEVINSSSHFPAVHL
eukprot:Nk52_evm7s349 gene=Nk52_evmTU7s349